MDHTPQSCFGGPEPSRELLKWCELELRTDGEERERKRWRERTGEDGRRRTGEEGAKAGSDR